MRERAVCQVLPGRAVPATGAMLGDLPQGLTHRSYVGAAVARTSEIGRHGRR